MNKIAVITDTNSGMLTQEADNAGIFLLHMPFEVDGQTYFDGIDLSHEHFYEKLTEGANVFTSMPAIADVMDLWDKTLRDYDEIVYIPMSSSLSSSFETAYITAQDYDGRVQVLDLQRISVTQRQSAYDAKSLAEKGYTAAQIKDKLEGVRGESSIYVTVDTLKHLKKGGRITPAAAALGELLKIKPVLQIQGGKLDSFEKARTMKKARQIMLDAVLQDIENRFDMEGHGENMNLAIAHSDVPELAEEFLLQVKEYLPKHASIVVAPLPLSIACHIGPGALALACTKSLMI